MSERARCTTCGSGPQRRTCLRLWTSSLALRWCATPGRTGINSSPQVARRRPTTPTFRSSGTLAGSARPRAGTSARGAPPSSSPSWTRGDLDHPDLVNKYDPVADRRDVINNTNTPDDLNPGGGHGTLCAGVAAAETNNTNGVAGVAPNCRIMPIRLWDGRPNKPAMTEVQIVAAIDWARTHGANVISMSWYFTGLTPNADVALDNAHAAGLVLVAASGNCRQNEGCSDASTVVW